MKRKAIVVIIYLLIVAALVFLAFVLFGDGEKIESKEEVPVDAEEEIIIDTPEEVAGKFFAVIYGYDTSKRMFYEGADVFMSKEAYEKLLPMPSGESVEESYFHMVSKLEHYLIYKREISKEKVELLAEVYFSVSGSGEYEQRQIVKLHMELQKEQWMITECSVLDTEGE